MRQGIVAKHLSLEEETLPPATNELPYNDAPSDDSLNAGLGDPEDETPDSEFEPPPISFEDTDIYKSTNELVVLEDRLNDLAALQKEIMNKRGMSQTFALEAERLIPGVTKVPVNYFTEQPTMTRYKQSLEDLSKGTWILIGTAVGAILAMIYRIYRWITGSSSDSGSGGGGGGGGGSSSSSTDKPTTAKEAEKGIDERVADVEKTADINKDMGKEIHQIDSILHSHGGAVKIYVYEKGKPMRDEKNELIVENLTTIRSLDHAIEILAKSEPEGRKAAFNSLLEPNGEMLDIIRNGPLTQSVRKCVPAIMMLIGMMELIIDGLEESIDRAGITNHRPFTEIEHVKISALMDKMRKAQDNLTIDLGNGRKPLADAIRDLNSKSHQLRAEVSQRPITFEEVFRGLSDQSKIGDFTRVLHTAKDLIRKTETLRDRLNGEITMFLKNRATDSGLHNQTTTNGPQLNMMISSMHSQLATAAQLLHFILGYTDKYTHLSARMANVVEYVVEGLSSRIKATGQELPEDWESSAYVIEEYRLMYTRNINYVAKLKKKWPNKKFKR